MEIVSGLVRFLGECVLLEHVGHVGQDCLDLLLGDGLEPTRWVLAWPSSRLAMLTVLSESGGASWGPWQCGGGVSGQLDYSGWFIVLVKSWRERMGMVASWLRSRTSGSLVTSMSAWA